MFRLYHGDGNSPDGHRAAEVHSLTGHLAADGDVVGADQGGARLPDDGIGVAEMIRVGMGDQQDIRFRDGRELHPGLRIAGKKGIDHDLDP